MTAQDMFLLKLAEIQSHINNLQAQIDDHFGVSVDDLNWAHVGSIAHVAEVLCSISSQSATK